MRVEVRESHEQLRREGTILAIVGSYLDFQIRRLKRCRPRLVCEVSRSGRMRLWAVTHEGAREWQKGTNGRRREEHYRAKLSRVEVGVMRMARKGGAPLKHIAAAWGVSAAQVSRICTGARWALSSPACPTRPSASP